MRPVRVWCDAVTRDADPIAPLIPWYATGTLAAEDSVRVEEHLPTCDACRGLLATARGFRRLAPGIPLETALGHVQAQLLVEYVDDPGSLEPDTRRFVATHLASCKDCAEALEILEDLGSTAAASADAAPAQPVSPGVLSMVRRGWRWLTRTLLRPLPALAYLAAAIVLLLFPPLREGEGEGARVPQPQLRPPVSVLPRATVLPEELLRRGPGEEPSAPIEILLRAGEEQLILELVTSIETEQLRDPDAAFHVEIAEGERLVFEALRHGPDFEPTGRLRLLLDPEALAAGPVHTVRLTFVKPGDPLDGEEVFRRSFRLVPEASPPS